MQVAAILVYLHGGPEEQHLFFSLAAKVRAKKKNNKWKGLKGSTLM